MTTEQTPPHLVEHQKRIARMREEEERNPRPVVVPDAPPPVAPVVVHSSPVPASSFGMPIGVPIGWVRPEESAGLRRELEAADRQMRRELEAADRQIETARRELADLNAQVSPVIDGLRRRVEDLDRQLALANDDAVRQGQAIARLEDELRKARAAPPTSTIG